MRRRSTGHPRNFALEFDLVLPDHRTATYGFEIAARGKGGFVVKKEGLAIRESSSGTVAHYEVSEGAVESKTTANMPVAAPDRLYLVTASNLPLFRDVYDSFLAMGFYNLNPDTMKKMQSPDAGDLLHRDGGNLASVVGRLKADKDEAFERLKQFLQTIVPSVSDVDRLPFGPSETLQFKQKVSGAEHPWTFYAAHMSDGTLRALGTLVAVAQLADRRRPVTLVGIEEPETALHPAAAEALIDALREASLHTQVLITTHSPDLLENIDAEKDSLYVVVSQDGTTHVAPIDNASLSAIKADLYTAGELLRMDQLQPDPDNLRQQEQLKFSFGTNEDDD